MRSETKKVFRCVSGSTPEEFQQKMNEILSTVLNPEITFLPSVPFTAYILTEETTTVPECLADEFSLRGERYICSACPYFERTNDLRRKWHYCVYHQQKCHQDTPMCEDAYKQIADGTITMRKGGRNG